MTDCLDISTIRGALARGYCHRGNRNKELDSTLLEAQANEIMAMIESLAVEEPALVQSVATLESVSPLSTPEDVRMVAYDLAIKGGYANGPVDRLHKAAADIASHILNGFDSKIENLTIKLDVDLSGLDAEIERRSDLIARQNETLTRQSNAIKRQQALIGEQREIIDQNNHILASIFGRVEWRREAWNDLKAVMIRVLNRQIAEPTDDSYILDKKSTLQQVSDFVASFQFDPEKP